MKKKRWTLIQIPRKIVACILLQINSLKECFQGFCYEDYSGQKFPLLITEDLNFENRQNLKIFLGF